MEELYRVPIDKIETLCERIEQSFPVDPRNGQMRKLRQIMVKRPEAYVRMQGDNFKQLFRR